MAYDPLLSSLLAHTDIPQPEQPTADDILSQLGSSALTGLGYVGSSLDKPGRAIRGVLGGNLRESLAWLPFSDALGITDPEDQVSGRDLLENLGLPENQPGLFNSPSDFMGDVLGFGAEVALDPLTYLGGLGAFTKSGQESLKAFGRAGSQTAKHIAGLTDDAAKAAARSASPDIAKALDEGVSPLADTLGGQIRAGQASLATVGVPKYGLFGEAIPGTEMHLGTGEGAAKFADTLGTLGDYLTYDAPITSHLASLFRSGQDGQRGTVGSLADAKNAEAAGDYADITAGLKPHSDTMAEQYRREADGTLISEPKQLTHLGPVQTENDLLFQGGRDGDYLFQSGRDPAPTLNFEPTADFIETPNRLGDVTPGRIENASDEFPDVGDYNPLTHPSRRAINGGDAEADLANMLFGGSSDPIADMLEGGQGFDALGKTVLKGATPTVEPAKTILRQASADTPGVAVKVNSPELKVRDSVDPLDNIGDAEDLDALGRLVDEDFAKGPIERPEILFQGAAHDDYLAKLRQAAEEASMYRDALASGYNRADDVTGLAGRKLDRAAGRAHAAERDLMHAVATSGRPARQSTWKQVGNQAGDVFFQGGKGDDPLLGILRTQLQGLSDIELAKAVKDAGLPIPSSRDDAIESLLRQQSGVGGAQDYRGPITIGKGEDLVGPYSGDYKTVDDYLIAMDDAGLNMVRTEQMNLTPAHKAELLARQADWDNFRDALDEVHGPTLPPNPEAVFRPLNLPKSTDPVAEIVQPTEDLLTRVAGALGEGRGTVKAISNRLLESGITPEELASLGLSSLGKNRYTASDILDHIATKQFDLPKTPKVSVGKAKGEAVVDTADELLPGWKGFGHGEQDSFIADAIKPRLAELADIEGRIAKAKGANKKQLEAQATAIRAQLSDLANNRVDALELSQAPSAAETVQTAQQVANQGARTKNIPHTVPDSIRNQFLDAVAAQGAAVGDETKNVMARYAGGGVDDVDRVLSLYDRAFEVAAKLRGISKDDIWGRVSIGFSKLDDIPAAKAAYAQLGKDVGAPPRAVVQSFTDGRHIITALETADVSAFVHELGHVLRKELPEQDLRALSNWLGNGQDADTVLKYLSGDTKVLTPEIRRAVEERYARAVEEYFRTGKAPTPEVKGVFQRLKTLLGTIYRQVVYGADGQPLTKATAKGRNQVVTAPSPPLVELSPEARAHFDKYFGGVEDVAPVAAKAPAAPIAQAVEQAADPSAARAGLVPTRGASPLEPEAIDQVVQLAATGEDAAVIAERLGLDAQDVARTIEAEAGAIDAAVESRRLAPSVPKNDVDNLSTSFSPTETGTATVAVKGSGDLIDVRAALEAAGGDQATAFADLRSKLQSHLAGGGKASLWLDGKEIPVAKVENGRILDEKGQQWGLQPLAMTTPGTKAGIELKAGGTLPPPTPKAAKPDAPVDPAKAAWVRLQSKRPIGDVVPGVEGQRLQAAFDAGLIKDPKAVEQFLGGAKAEAPTTKPGGNAAKNNSDNLSELNSTTTPPGKLPPPPPKGPPPTPAEQAMAEEALPPNLRHVARKLLEEKPLTAAEEKFRTPEVTNVVKAVREVLDKSYAEALDYGMVDLDFIIDEVYAARYSAHAAYNKATKNKKGTIPGFWQWIQDLTKRKTLDKREGGKALSTFSPSDLARREELLNWQEGTTGINKAVRQWAGKALDDKMKSAVATALERPGKETAKEFNARVEKVSKFLHSLPAKLSTKDAPDFFPRDIVDDVHTYAQYMTRKVAAGGIIHRLFARSAAVGGEGVSLVDTLSKSLPGWPKKGSKNAASAENRILSTFLRDNADVLKESGIKSLDDLKKATVPAGDVEAATKYIKYTEANGLPELQPMLKVVDQITDITKKGLTVPWPAFHVRNFTSGQFVNLVSGDFDPAAVKKANDLWWGKSLSGADKKLLEEIAIYKIADPSYGTRGIGNSITEQAKELQDIQIKTGKGAYDRQLSRVQDSDNLSSKLPGIMQKGQAAGQVSAEYVEFLNRVGQFVALRKKGWSPRAAMEKVNETHHVYSNQSRFEKSVMSRMVPFYSFARRNLPWTLEQLLHQPGGPLAKTIRASNVAREDAFVPDYVGGGIVAPVGPSEDGKSYRYLSGLGLPIEEAFDRFDPGSIERTADHHLAMLNPLAKLPLELWSGKQLFSGKKLEDLHPFPTGNTVADQVLFNSPVARGITAARTLADDRKGPLTKAVNLLSGARITDVDLEQAKQIARRRALEDLLADSPNIYESVVYGKKKGVELSPEEQAILAEYQRSRKQ